MYTEDMTLLTSICAVRSLAYKLSEQTHALRESYLLSHWNKEYLYLCLPDFSLCPKIVRLGLEYQPAGGPVADIDPYAIQILTRELFFPNSTPRRNPRILYRHGSNARKRDELVLALDSLHLSNSSGKSSQVPPMVVMWKIEKELWQTWNLENDGEPHKVWPSVQAYYDIRGTFLDRNRRSQVIVRSRLDYTKESYLSCL